VEQPLLLPPLERMQPVKASSDNNTVVLPCFPLPLARVAFPGTERTLNICEPRYVTMYADMLHNGASSIAVPKMHRGPDGIRLSGSCVVFQLCDLKDGPAGTNYRYTCRHKVSRRMRIHKVLNPEVFQDASTYLQVECSEIQDTDADSQYSVEERALIDALWQVVEARASAGDPLRRWELSHDARGVPWLTDNAAVPTISEESLNGVSADRLQGLWHLAGLWQGYGERRVIALRQARDRVGKGEATLRGDVSAEDRERSEKRLRADYDAEAASVAEATTKLMQRLLSSDSHGSRLALLTAAAAEETQRLAAVAALRASLGGGPMA